MKENLLYDKCAKHHKDDSRKRIYDKNDRKLNRNVCKQVGQKLLLFEKNNNKLAVVRYQILCQMRKSIAKVTREAKGRETCILMAAKLSLNVCE